MKFKYLFVAAIIFFLLVNTTQLWEAKIGSYAMITFLLMVIFFVVLTVFFIGQLLSALYEKFKDRKRVSLIIFLGFVLVSTYLFPHGLINFKSFKSEAILLAQREGVANCMTTLALKPDHQFVHTEVCFGIRETSGNYHISNDTIYFENINLSRGDTTFYAYAIIQLDDKNKNDLGTLVRYKNNLDTIGNPLWITINKMKP